MLGRFVKPDANLVRCLPELGAPDSGRLLCGRTRSELRRRAKLRRPVNGYYAYSTSANHVERIVWVCPRRTVASISNRSRGTDSRLPSRRPLLRIHSQRGRPGPFRSRCRNRSRLLHRVPGRARRNRDRSHRPPYLIQDSPTLSRPRSAVSEELPTSATLFSGYF